MAATAGITFMVTYPCPHCGVSLEARTGRVSSYLRCPECQKGGLPPDHTHRPSHYTLPPGEEMVILDPVTPPTAGPITAAAPVAPWRDLGPVEPYADGVEPLSTRRVVITTTLFIAVTSLVFSFLSGSVMGTSIASGTGLICLILLALPSRS